MLDYLCLKKKTTHKKKWISEKDKNIIKQILLTTPDKTKCLILTSEWMNEWMFNDTPAQNINWPLGVKQIVT